MPNTSISIIVSPIMKKAGMMTQKGVVPTKTKAIAKGIKVNEKFSRAKVNCPDRDLLIISLRAPFGKPLKGFCLLQANLRHVARRSQQLLKKQNSITETSSAAMCLKSNFWDLDRITKMFINMMAFHMQSYLSGGFA